MRFVLFLLSFCFLVLAAPMRRAEDALSLISALNDGLRNGQVTDITSTSQSLASLPTDTVTPETRSHIAIETASIITLSLAKDIAGDLKDLIVNLEKCVPGVDKEIYRIMNVGTAAKLRANSNGAAAVLNQAELKVAGPVGVSVNANIRA